MYFNFNWQQFVVKKDLRRLLLSKIKRKNGNTNRASKRLIKFVEFVQDCQGCLILIFVTIKILLITDPFVICYKLLIINCLLKETSRLMFWPNIKVTSVKLHHVTCSLIINLLLNFCHTMPTCHIITIILNRKSIEYSVESGLWTST